MLFSGQDARLFNKPTNQELQEKLKPRTQEWCRTVSTKIFAVLGHSCLEASPKLEHPISLGSWAPPSCDLSSPCFLPPIAVLLLPASFLPFDHYKGSKVCHCHWELGGSSRQQWPKHCTHYSFYLQSYCCSSDLLAFHLPAAGKYVLHTFIIHTSRELACVTPHKKTNSTALHLAITLIDIWLSVL